MHKEFNELYSKLNAAQKDAVDTIEGPVMVIAGPGTGKTQILTLRIANILRLTDIPPDAILALTFTESGAYSMRKRLVEIIGGAAYKVNIYTFHSFCNEIIKKYPESFPRIIGSANVTDVDQIRIMERIFEENDFATIKPYGDIFYYVRSALDAIKNLKREDVDPKKFTSLIKAEEKEFKNIPDLYHEKGKFAGSMKGKYKDIEKKITKNKELAVVYTQYEQELAKERLYDYEDMIMEVVRVLVDDKDLLLELQEKYQYILADEHQDANNAQNRILELLSNFHDNPNLFVVGDEKQAIFRFQGASLDNFLYFKNLYPHSHLVTLKENYRSTQPILDAAHSLILKNLTLDEKLRITLKSNTTYPQQNIRIRSFENPEHELDFLLSDIQRKINSGTPAESIAVLYRDNKDAFPLMTMLEKTDIPFSVESNRDILSDEEIYKLLLLLQTVNDLSDDAMLGKLLFVDFLNLPDIDVYRLLQHCKKNKISYYEALKSEYVLKEAGIADIGIFLALSQKLSHFAAMGHNKSLPLFFETVVRESSFLEHLLSSKDSLQKLAKLHGFFELLKEIEVQHKDSRLADLIEHIRTLQDHHLYLKNARQIAPQKGVRLMTAHRSKGLEFDYIYIIFAHDKHWGNKREISHFHLPLKSISQRLSFEVNEDERRLFYVALTRAKKEAAISFSSAGFSGEPQLGSQFLEEIDRSFIEQDVSSYALPAEKLLIANFAARRHSTLDLSNHEFLRMLFLEQGMSVTALNNYLACPWNYFFNNLIRIPKSASRYQMYGTAVHAALREFFDKWRLGESPTAEYVQDVFALHLNRQPLSTTDFKDLLTKGQKSLGGYYDFYGSWPRSIQNEMNVAGVFLPVQSRNEEYSILLKGVIDKVEHLGEGKEVNVVDYKTSKPKTRNQIEGKTKSSDANYKRQLVFYKLLLERYEKGIYEVLSGEIDFTEPDDKGRYHKERFDLTADEVIELESEITRVSEEILEFSFWENTCNEKDCEYCALRQAMGV